MSLGRLIHRFAIFQQDERMDDRKLVEILEFEGRRARGIAAQEIFVMNGLIELRGRIQAPLHRGASAPTQWQGEGAERDRASSRRRAARRYSKTEIRVAFAARQCRPARAWRSRRN